ncbi:MAG: zinc-ribbon domain-containing protein [Anaerolineae bacterium]|nr:zinc-ribbon domain-containing protein [Anaerolineae bacterium]
MTIQRFFQESTQRARFEADKLQRTLKVQNAISGLRSQANSQVGHLGQEALRLHRERGLAEAELTAISEAIEHLEAQIVTQEAELAQIKGETFEAVLPATPPAPQPKPEGNVCAHCGQALPAGMRFCIKCGQPLAEA